MRLVEYRRQTSFIAAFAVWTVGLRRFPLLHDNAVWELTRAYTPAAVEAIEWIYLLLWFTTPYLAASMVVSLGYVFVRNRPHHARIRLPRYPRLAERFEPSLVIGEVHHPKKPVPRPQPRWLVIPQRGLYTGIAVIGAVGSGKTTCCMYPFAEQIFGYRAADPARRAGGLVLEVKGDFCHKVREILTKHGRAEDYVEITLDGGYCYNPLANDRDPHAQAYGIASLLSNLFGKGKEPFWQQAYTNLVKFIISLHKALDDYVTLFDIYECVINRRFCPTTGPDCIIMSS